MTLPWGTWLSPQGHQSASHSLDSLDSLWGERDLIYKNIYIVLSKKKKQSHWELSREGEGTRVK